MKLFKHAFARIRTVLAALALGSLVLAPQALVQLPTQKDIHYHNDLAGTPMAATDGAGNVLWRPCDRRLGDRPEKLRMAHLGDLVIGSLAAARPT